jgi:putative ABC transport system permease protein
VYGTFTCAVRHRTREIGVRLAIGAAPGDIVRMILRSSGGLIVVALAIGVPLALAGSRSLKAILYEVSPADPVTIAAITAAIVAAALVATYVPARSASRIDPSTALRQD